MTIQEMIETIENNSLQEQYNNFVIERYGNKIFNAGELFTSMKQFLIEHGKYY